MKQSSIVKNSVIIMTLTIISKITGFLRDILVASVFGTTYETDAYNISLTIPVLAFALVGTAVSTIFVPIFTRILKERGKEQMYIFANKVLIILFVIILLLCLVFFGGAQKVVGIIAPNFNEVTTDLTTKLTKICVVNLIFLSIYSIFAAMLQTLQEFISVALVGIVINIPIIIYILGFNSYGIMGLTVASVIGYFLQVVIQIPSLIKQGYKFKFSLDFSDKIFKEIPFLLLPVIIGVGINEVNTFVDQVVASGLEEGTISAVNLSNKINIIIYGIYAVSIVTAIYPVLAGEVDKIDSFKRHISKGICSITMILLPSSVGIMVLSKEIVRVMFERGMFDENSVKMTAVSTFFLAIGVTFYSIRDIISKAFYALQDTSTPMKNGIAGVCVNIILDITLSKIMGIGGLALATSISAITTAVLLYISLKKKINRILEKSFIIDLIKVVISTVVMAVVVYLFKPFIVQESGVYLLISLFIVVFIGAFIYFAMLKMLKTNIYEEQICNIRKKIRGIFLKVIKNNEKVKNIYTYENRNK